jgi:hypothetical protein
MTATARLNRILRLSGAALLVSMIITGASATSLQAGDWIYRRSYFSHVLPPDVAARYPAPESRSAYRVPMVYEAPTAGIRGVYRYNPIILYDGRSSDITIYRQNWIQFQP